MAKETTTLGGGCFWCLEAVYDQLKGVDDVVSGYAGGRVPNPTYQQVCTGTTGHAEVVQVAFDPDVISFREILEVFFTIHDPTTLNRQGADVGTQYRSAIFYHTPEQRATAEQVIADITQASLWDNADCDRSRAARHVLSGRGLSPGIFRAQPEPGLLPRHHCPQGRQVPQVLLREAEARNGRIAYFLSRRLSTHWPRSDWRGR